MSAAVLPDEPQKHHGGATPATSRFGMIIFLASEAMLFSGLIAAYCVLRGSANGFPWQPGHAWPPDPAMPPLPLFLTSVNTVFLVTSSLTFHFGEAAVRKGKSGLGFLFLTILLGASFVGIQGFEWSRLFREGLWFDKGGPYGSTFFVVTGFHGMHVAIGVLLIIWCFLRQTFTRCFTPRHHAALSNVALYWHFVDAVWLVLFTLLYWI